MILQIYKLTIRAKSRLGHWVVEDEIYSVSDQKLNEFAAAKAREDDSYIFVVEKVPSL